jgi:hypothetical protein
MVPRILIPHQQHVRVQCCEQFWVVFGDDAGFIKKKLLIMKHGFINMTQNRNKSRYSGTRRMYHPLGSLKSSNRSV